MKQPKSPLMKVILYGIAVLGFLFVALVLWIILALTISGRHDKQNVQVAVSEIKLPAQYQLTSSKYDNQRCLDVCAHTILIYQSADGSKLDKSLVTNELESLGYRYDGYYYSKTLNQKVIHTTVNDSSTHNQISIDVSL